MAKRRILVVDFANSLYTHFHFHSLDKPWQFLCNIRTLADQFSVDKILFLPEGGKSKYRLNILPSYKGQRKEQADKDTPEEKARRAKFLAEDFPEALRLAQMLGIVVASVKDTETDDVMAYIANHINVNDYECLLVSTDKDMLQLLRPGVVLSGYNKAMVLPLSGGQKIPAKMWLNSKVFTEQYEIEPWQYGHVLGLAGDICDNVPSPKGLGAGAALKMIQQHGSVQGVEDNLSTLKISRMPQKVLDVLQASPCLCYAHRNLMLTDLKHTPEVEQTIFGSEGIGYLNNILATLDEPGCPDKEAFKEYCYEQGKVSIVDKIDFWLQPFSR